MRVIQGAGDLPYHLGRFRWLSGEAFASAQPGLERFPTDQLGIEVAEPLVLVRLVERDDVRVPEPGGNPRVAFEAFADFPASCRIMTKDLERDLAVKLRVMRQEDDRRRAPANDAADCVAAKSPPSRHPGTAGLDAPPSHEMGGSGLAW